MSCSEKGEEKMEVEGESGKERTMGRGRQKHQRRWPASQVYGTFCESHTH